MPKSVDEITDEAIREGGILAVIYFDLHANSKDAVKQLLVGSLAKLSKEPGVIYAVGEIDEPIESEGLFSSSAEVKILTKDYISLQTICAQYGPIGVEILQPYEIKLTLGEAQDALLRVAETVQEYAKIILDKIMSPEDKEKYQKALQQRAELGKRLLEKK